MSRERLRRYGFHVPYSTTFEVMVNVAPGAKKVPPPPPPSLPASAVSQPLKVKPGQLRFPVFPMTVTIAPEAYWVESTGTVPVVFAVVLRYVTV